MQQMATYDFAGSKSSVLTLGILSTLSESLAETGGAVIIDEKVHSLYKDKLALPADMPMLTLPAGEKHKTMQTAADIYRFLSDNTVTRDTCVFVLGGGSITDVAAYAVSTFKRGCRLVLIPTTLLGMTDAALGGKTAVNTDFLKNSIGTFYPAEEIILLPDFQSTLSAEDLQNGLAEMLKLWFINPELSDLKPNKHNMITPEQILEYAKAKLAICSADPEDRGQRRLLNLGHTFGHMLESVSRYSLPHGAAVALGMAIALRLSSRMGSLDSETAARIEAILLEYGLPVHPDASLAKRLLEKADMLIRQDKKAIARGLPLVLFKGFRQVYLEESAAISSVTELLPDCL
jgi:3-dehydroquinate synthase